MKLFTCAESETLKPSNEHFFLHTHTSYEIYLFLEGDSRYVVEGKSYTLSPGDIIVIRKHEMHRVYHNSSAKYRRITINAEPEFFEMFRCREYERQFTDNSFDGANKISSATVHSSGIYDAVMRMKKYTNDFKNTDTPIAISSLTEILYLISRLKSFSKADRVNRRLDEILSFVNENYTQDISLEQIEELFFFSKYHICRLFKKETGLTFRQYINKKRFSLVHDLLSGGTSIGEAAAAAGFGSYPAFYRAYVKEYGTSPKNSIKSTDSL